VAITTLYDTDKPSLAAPRYISALKTKTELVLETLSLSLVALRSFILSVMGDLLL
jgi:hypothetical protein